MSNASYQLSFEGNINVTFLSIVEKDPGSTEQMKIGALDRNVPLSAKC
jgi:hypothetical protein